MVGSVVISPGSEIALWGKITNVQGEPLANAEVSVWQTGADGLYDIQVDASGTDYRGVFTTNGQGDFLIRGLLGVDHATGAIEIGGVVEVGETVQFQVRDAVGADKDLRLTVERAAAELPGRPVGALLFTCNGRGRRMFGVADHDASTIDELLGGIPLAGFFAAGEIGPIAGRNALHAFTASMALFTEDTG